MVSSWANVKGVTRYVDRRCGSLQYEHDDGRHARGWKAAPSGSTQLRRSEQEVTTVRAALCRPPVAHAQPLLIKLKDRHKPRQSDSVIIAQKL